MPWIELLSSGNKQERNGLRITQYSDWTMGWMTKKFGIQFLAEARDLSLFHSIETSSRVY
jgi:hypothetical protein